MATTKQQKPKQTPKPTIDEVIQHQFLASVFRPVEVYDLDTGWRDEAEVDAINRTHAILKGIVDTLARDAKHGKKFPVGSPAGRRPWQRAVVAFAATRPQDDTAVVLRALEQGACADLVHVVAFGKACGVIKACAAGSHFHSGTRDTVSWDQVLRYLRRLCPPAPRPPARWTRRPQK